MQSVGEIRISDGGNQSYDPFHRVEDSSQPCSDGSSDVYVAKSYGVIENNNFFFYLALSVILSIT